MVGFEPYHNKDNVPNYSRARVNAGFVASKTSYYSDDVLNWGYAKSGMTEI